MNVWQVAAEKYQTTTAQHVLYSHQRPPAQPWDLWILEAGRGAGKTQACAHYMASYMRKHPKARARIIAPTSGDAVESCVYGPSGILAMDPTAVFKPSAMGGSKIVWPNAAEALILGMHSPADIDRLRASGNRELDWWEEMAAIRRLGEAWDMAAMGLRSGTRPHSIASTTPKALPAYRKLRSEGGVALTHGTMDDNPNLDHAWKQRMRDRYAGTRLGLQEIEGQLLADVEGALWTLDMIGAATWPENDPLPELGRVVVSVDPSGSATGDATGIVTVAATPEGIPFVIADDTTQGTPEHRYRTVCRVAAHHDADVILYEGNYGGDNIPANIRSTWNALLADGTVEGVLPRIMPTADMRPPLKGGKAERAEVIAALYEQHAAGTERVWHLPGLAKLADELTTWEPDSSWSPNRLDALVYGVRFHTRHLGREPQHADVSSVDTFRKGIQARGLSPFGAGVGSWSRG